MTLSTTTVCECGGHYSSKENRITHVKSLRHKKWVETGVKHTVIYTTDLTDEERLQRQRQYMRNYYKGHKEIWLNCPSRKRTVTTQTEVN